MCSVFCVLTGGEERGQGMANSLIFLTSIYHINNQMAVPGFRFGNCSVTIKNHSILPNLYRFLTAILHLDKHKPVIGNVFTNI